MGIEKRVQIMKCEKKWEMKRESARDMTKKRPKFTNADLLTDQGEIHIIPSLTPKQAQSIVPQWIEP